MGAGYHGGFGKTKGEKKRKKTIENIKKNSVNLIDEKIVLEMEKNKIKFTKDRLVFVTKDKLGQTLF